MKKNKFVIRQKENSGQYLESHAQWPVFKTDIKHAKIFNSKVEAENVFKFWGRKVYGVIVPFTGSQPGTQK